MTKLLKEMRKYLWISETEMAHLLWFTRMNYRNAESRRIDRLDDIQKLSQFCRVSIEDMQDDFENAKKQWKIRLLSIKIAQMQDEIDSLTQ